MLSFQTTMNNIFYFVNGLSPKKSSYNQCKRVTRSVTSYCSCSPDCCLCYVVAFARGLQWECFKQLSMKGLDFAEKVGDMPRFKGSYKICDKMEKSQNSLKLENLLNLCKTVLEELEGPH